MNFLVKIVAKWRNYWGKRKSPSMIYNYIDAHDNMLHKTGVSTSTFIDYPENLTLGNRVYIGHHNFIEASNNIVIEDGCQITTFCTITTHSSHQSIRLYGYHYAGGEMVGYRKGSVHIGKFSFIGPYTTIMPDTRIGKGCIVSAYSYVQGDFPDFSIIAGNPAKIIGDTRNTDKLLLEKHPELKYYYNEWSNENYPIS